MLLHLVTATENASIALSEGGKVLKVLYNRQQKDHAGWIHVAIDTLFHSLNLSMQDLSGVSVAAGPGSYTGLRVGMATAKGICYALKIPLITENTLKIMAYAAVSEMEPVKGKGDNLLYCPMIDARRMEVYSAIYDNVLNELLPPAAIILNENSYENFLSNNTLLFFGDGNKKFRKIISSTKAIFEEVDFHAGHLATLAEKKFNNSEFADLAFSDPVYLKDFYTQPKK